MICKGKSVRIAFDLMVDGKLVQSVHPGKPLKYLHAENKNRTIPLGLEKGLKGMKLGEKRKIVLPPKAGYGLQNSESIMEMPKSRFSKRDHFIGREVKSVKDGKYLATVVEVRKNTLVLNFNHPFAGKTLEYSVLVVGIEGEGV